MNKKVNITKVLANKLDSELDNYLDQIKTLSKGFSDVDKSKLKKLKDTITRTKGDLWRNCISNPMV